MKPRALALLLLAGCRHDPSPSAVLHRYQQLLREGHVEAAYELTSARYRARHDVVSFAAQVARQPAFEARAVDADVVLELPGDDGPIALAGRDAAHLTLLHDPLDAYPQDTPEASLRSFARAVTHDRRDSLDRLISPALRARLAVRTSEPLPKSLVDAAAMIRLRLAPTATLAAPIVELAGDGHARLLLEEGVAIGLDEQLGSWQISELP